MIPSRRCPHHAADSPHAVSRWLKSVNRPTQAFVSAGYAYVSHPVAGDGPVGGWGGHGAYHHLGDGMHCIADGAPPPCWTWRVRAAIGEREVA